MSHHEFGLWRDIDGRDREIQRKFRYLYPPSVGFHPGSKEVWVPVGIPNVWSH
jgi:elongation factor P hydroxylase